MAGQGENGQVPAGCFLTLLRVFASCSLNCMYAVTCVIAVCPPHFAMKKGNLHKLTPSMSSQAQRDLAEGLA